MDLMYNYVDCPPQFVTYTRYLGQKVYTINYGLEEVIAEESQGELKYRYVTTSLPAGQYDRATVISTIIRQKYRDDEMQAIINNYLLDPEDPEALLEFNQMQEYRKFAKRVADDFLKAIE